MRVPYKINKNTFEAYRVSPETKALLGEVLRTVLPEDFDWDKDECPALATLSMNVIIKNFAKEPLLDELTCTDRDYLLENLDVNLPLDFVIPLIEEEIYWKRRYDSKFGMVTYTPPKEWTWKSLYLERHMQEMLEEAQPEHRDEEDMGDITRLCVQYIHSLRVTQLQAWKPPLHWDEEDIPEVWPIDHIDFTPIFQKLVNIEEFDVIYGTNHVGDKFRWNMFKLSVNDCNKLGKAINYLKNLRILKIHRSRLEDAHIRSLTHGLIKNHTIEELDLSHCEMGDEGALCMAKILIVHPKIKILNLCDNRIGCRGCEGLGFALLTPECNLEKLDLKLNPLGEGGAMGIMRALVRGTKLEEFSMAACEFVDDAPIRAGQMLKLNTSLKKLDVSNNWFDEEGGQALIEGVESNRTIHWLDVRETDITHSQLVQIKKYLLRNRLGLESIDDIVDVSEEQQPTEEDQPEPEVPADLDHKSGEEVVEEEQ